MKGIESFRLACLGAVLFGLWNCADNATGPARSKFWVTESNAAGFPDTLVYGDTARFTVVVGDSGGNGVALVISGIPSSQYLLGPSTDSASVNFTLIGDRLSHDSLYTVTVRAIAAGTGDTLTRLYTVLVRDPDRLGGVRHLVQGMWWTEIRHDTVYTRKDSANQSWSSSGVYVFEKTSRVVRTWVTGGTRYSQVLTVDSQTNRINGDSVVRTGYQLEHSAAGITMKIPVGAFFIDTLAALAMPLPLGASTSWTVATANLDTAVRLFLNIPMFLYFTFDSHGDLRGSSSGNLGGNNWGCKLVERRSTIGFGLTLDTAITIGTDTLAVGDTITSSVENNLATGCFSPDLDADVWARETKIGYDTNWVEKVVTRDTTKSSASIKSLYDPRRGVTLGN